jgi:sulfur carrier protein ThiS
VVKVLIFASLKQVAGRSSANLEGPLRVSDIIKQLGLEKEQVITAINGSLCGPDAEASGNDEVALMPVFSGG